MRKTLTALLALGVFAAAPAFAANDVRFSQVYGGGGGATGYYAYDYVELFNSGCAAVDMSGWQLQYGSATGLFASNTFSIATLPAGAIIQSCGYYLVQVGSSVAGPPAIPVTPDFINTTGPNLSGTAGKLALLPAGTATGQTCEVITPLAIDMYGYGSATCFEGTAGPVGGVALVAVRNLGGRTDTDNNLADFATVAQPVLMHSVGCGYLNPECVTECTTPGACCQRGSEGACVVVTQAECEALAPVDGVSAVFMGVGVPCDSGNCTTPARKLTWGQLKTKYR
jgi:hypothetical protein